MPAAVVVFCLFVVPLCYVIWLSFGGQSWTIRHYLQVLQDPAVLEVLGYTLGLSFGVAIATLVLGYPVAHLLITAGERIRRLVLLTVLASFWMSILVRTYAWMVLLSRNGVVNTALEAARLTEEPITFLYRPLSVYIGMVHIMLPFMILTLYSIMHRIDYRLVAAARTLGAGPGLAFWLVYFPLSVPAVIAGTLLVFVLSIGFFITPAMLGGLGDITFVMLIEQEISRFLNWELAAAMTVVLLLTTAVLLAAMRVLVRRESKHGSINLEGLLRLVNRLLFAGVRAKRLMALKMPVSWLSPVIASPGFVVRCIARAVFRVLPWVTMLYLVIPLAVIFPLAFSDSPFLAFPPSSYSLRWFEEIFSGSNWLTPVFNSVRLGVLVALIATILGTLAAIPVVRLNFRFKALVFGLMLAPMLVPVIVLAVALNVTLVAIGMNGTLSALVAGHVLLALPFVILLMVNALRSSDERLEMTARTLGATGWAAFREVTLVLLRPAVLTSALFAFLASFDELVIALFLAGPKTNTLPKRLWDSIREEIEPTTAAVAVGITLVSVGVLAAASALRGKSLFVANTRVP